MMITGIWLQTGLIMLMSILSCSSRNSQSSHAEIALSDRGLRDFYADWLPNWLLDRSISTSTLYYRHKNPICSQSIAVYDSYSIQVINILIILLNRCFWAFFFMSLSIKDTRMMVYLEKKKFWWYSSFNFRVHHIQGNDYNCFSWLILY